MALIWQGYLKPMKVNCKEGIVRMPKDYFTKFKPDNQKPIAENFSGGNEYLTDSGWFLTQAEIDEGEVTKLYGNSREVGQMRNAALFNYFCGE